MILQHLCLFFAGLAVGFGVFAAALFIMFRLDSWFLSYARVRRAARVLAILSAVCLTLSAVCGLIGPWS